MRVLLIHGLARTSLSLLSLEQRLRAEGFLTEQCGYFAFAEKFDAIALRLYRRFQSLVQQGPYAVVAHSLGGLLTRSALTLGSVDAPVHTVMLGPPNQPPRLAAYAWRLPPFRWVTGQCGFNLTCSQFYSTLPPLPGPYTIIAGTAGPQGPLSPFGLEPNDGVVALSETRMVSNDQLVQFPVWHTLMMNSPAVQSAVIKALSRRHTT